MPPDSDLNDETLVGDRSSPELDEQTRPAKPGIVGTMVGGRYLIEKELGRGGIGAVYLARDKPELMSRRVVVKVLLEDSLKNELVVQKFHQEIESLTRLDDPGVVGVFDAGKLEDGSPFLVMQYVDGASLRTEIKQGGMDLMRAADIMRQIGRTLQVAHAEGIIHRDLKPENIMLRPTTSGDVQVKVIDFGIAKVKNSVVAPNTVTGDGIAGTIGYMSSEQLQAQSITPATDVYALGAIAYEMLTGNKPFNPETGFQLLEMQRAGVRVRPKDLRPAIPEQAQEVILKALSFAPVDRYQDAAEFGDALSNALTVEFDPLEVPTAVFDVSSGRRRENSRSISTPGMTQPAQTVASSGQRRTMELAHVLFLDIVGYTRLPIDIQTKTLEQLHEILRNTEDFARSQANNQLLRLPSGDGMALVFFGDAEAPARCALETSKALKAHPEIKLRMGVHSGPVDPIIDVNEIPIVTGAGINTAQRVMDCGDTGHILLSKRIADDLGQYSRWREHLHDLGEVTVKHGERVHIVNLYTNEAGNPELPMKFRKVKKFGRSISLVAAILLLVVIGGTLALWRPWSRTVTDSKPSEPNAAVAIPEVRSFTYFLTPSDKGKRVEEKHFAGNEIFLNGDKFRFVLKPEQAGTLYLLNQGPGNSGTDLWSILFPDPKIKNGSPEVAASETIEVRIEFYGKPGNENLLIIWSAQPRPELEKIFKDAAKTQYEIIDPDQIETVKKFLATYASPEPMADVDAVKKQTTIRGTSDIFIRKQVLEHVTKY